MKATSAFQHLTAVVAIVLLGLFTSSCARTTRPDAASVTRQLPGNVTLLRAPLPTDPIQAWIYELDNGLRVYITENHQEPRFYSEIAVRAGSKHDPAETTGLAHYLEHLLFKGTTDLGTLDHAAEKPHLERIAELYEEHFQEDDPARRAEIYEEINAEAQLAAQYAVPNEFDKVYKAMGATQTNAHTWVEETVYKVELPSNRFRQWATLEADRFADPVFRLFHTELETVYEEKNRAMDDKSRLIAEAVNRELFKVHPYGQQPTIGEAEHLKNPSIRNIERYYETYYVPNNMSIMISGDINHAEAIATIAGEFGAWQAQPLPDPQQWEEEPLQGTERVTVNYPGEEYVLLAWRTVSHNHPDAAALTVFDMILDNRTAGLININLVTQQQVRSAGSYPQMHNDAGAQYLWGIPKADQTLAQVERLLIDQIDLVRRGEFEDWIIEAIVNDFKKSQKQLLETNTGRVSIMSDAFLALRDWEEQLAEIDRLAEVTREDVIRVANEYFGPNYIAGYRRDAQHEIMKIDKPEIEELEIDPTRQSPYAQMILALPVEEIAPEYINTGSDFQKIELNNGRTLYYAPNPVNDLFTFRISIDKGFEHDNSLAPAKMLMDKSGAGDFSAEELAQEWYKVGTDHGLVVGAAETNLYLAGLDENFADSLELLNLLLGDPKSDEQTLEELISIILVQREDEMKDPQSVSRALMAYNRYGEESPYLNRMPSDQLRAATREQLYGAIQELLNYQHTIEYTGSLPLDEVKRLVAEAFPVESQLAAPPAYPFKRVREVGQTEILFVEKETAQSQVRIETGSVDFNEQDMPAVLLYNTYFAGGLSGIVYQELRESRGLVYFAGAVYATGERVGDQNIMIGAMGTQADKTAEALRQFLYLMDNMPKTPERFAEARASLESRYRTERIGFRDVIGAVRSWERLGLAPDPREQRFAEIAESEMQLILDFWNKYIAGKPKIISIVGDENRINMEALREIAPIQELTVDQLFVE